MNLGHHRITRRALAGVVAAAALAVPAQASAATAWVAGGKLYLADGGGGSNVKVARVGDNFVLSDPAQSLTAGWACPASGRPAKLTCSTNGVTSVVAVLGDGSDRFDGSTLAIPASVAAGAGNDVVLTQNGVADKVDCGNGIDSGGVDSSDVLAANCESTVQSSGNPVATTAEPPVEQPATEPPADGSPVDQPTVVPPPGDDESTGPAAEAKPPIKITTPGAMNITPKGDLTIGVACTAASGNCKGTVELYERNGTLKARTVVNSARRRKTSKHGTLLGRRNFSVRAGRKKNVRLRLERRGRQRIIKKKKKGRKTRGKLVITVTAPDGTKTTTEKNVTIGPPKARRGSSRGRSGGNRKASAR